VKPLNWVGIDVFLVTVLVIYWSPSLAWLLTDAEDDFVIAVSAGDELAPSAPYRCHKHLNFLREWLRLKGVKVQKPIHTLRKEVGSLIASEQGIFAASRHLRHADI
jgi:hypothetical protein